MNNKTSLIRKIYKARLAFRVCVLVLTIAMYFAQPQSFLVMKGINFFRKISWLHFLWIVWVVDMIIKMLPKRGFVSIGSLKQFNRFHKPSKMLLDRKKIVQIHKKAGIESLKVLAVWFICAAAVGALCRFNVLHERELLLICTVLYVLDLLFVLYWCPIRVLIMKNRCCITCRIFNWDHLMIFSPLLFVQGFYTLSLIFFAAVILLIWELSFILHPERFQENTNTALQCDKCTEKLCGYKNRVEKSAERIS